MRITRTIIATLSMAMLTFTLFACESDEKKQPKTTEGAAAEQAEESPKAQEQKANNDDDGVFTFNRDEFLAIENEEFRRKDPLDFFEWATGEEACKDIDNPVKKQDCIDKISIKEVCTKIHKEEIGISKTLLKDNDYRDVRVSSRPESRFLCNYIAAPPLPSINAGIVPEEGVEQLKKLKSQNKESSTRCVPLVENKYIFDFYVYGNRKYYNDIVIFNSKEDAMNFDEKASAVSVKLKRRIFVYGSPFGYNSPARHTVNVYYYDSKGPEAQIAAWKAEATKIWSAAKFEGMHTFDEAEKLCSSRGERLPTAEDLKLLSILKDKELVAKFGKIDGGEGRWSSSYEETVAYFYYCQVSEGTCRNEGIKQKDFQAGVVCVKK